MTFLQHQHSVFVLEWSEITVKFEQILAALSFGPADDDTDTWLPARHSSTCTCSPAQHPLYGAPSYGDCLNCFTNPNFYRFLLPRAKMSCQTSQKMPILSISKIWVHVMTFCLNVLPEALPARQELRSARAICRF